jgi:hypothetical protein
VSKYRLTTNGTSYRIQKLHRYRFLWWTWERWKDVTYSNENDPSGTKWPRTFNHQYDARTFARKLQNEDKAMGEPEKPYVYLQDAYVDNPHNAD